MLRRRLSIGAKQLIEAIPPPRRPTDDHRVCAGLALTVKGRSRMWSDGSFRRYLRATCKCDRPQGSFGDRGARVFHRVPGVVSRRLHRTASHRPSTIPSSRTTVRSPNLHSCDESCSAPCDSTESVQWPFVPSRTYFAVIHVVRLSSSRQSRPAALSGTHVSASLLMKPRPAVIMKRL